MERHRLHLIEIVEVIRGPQRFALARRHGSPRATDRALEDDIADGIPFPQLDGEGIGSPVEEILDPIGARFFRTAEPRHLRVALFLGLAAGDELVRLRNSLALFYLFLPRRL